MSKKRNAHALRPEPRRFEIQFTRAAERGFSALDKLLLRQCDVAIRGLADAPHPPGSKKLRGEDDVYRIRVGDHRIIYQVDDDQRVVLILNLGHLRDIYRDR
jgi:mRNA interferase RelE/StbE